MIPSDSLPPRSDWITAKFLEYDRQLRELAAARTLEAATVGAGGVTIKNGGTLRVLHEDGVTELLAVRRNGVGAYIVTMHRDDGSTAFEIQSLTPGPGQYWALFDRAHNVVVSDDAISGAGLARPHLSWNMAPTSELLTIPAAQSTTSATFTAVWTTYGEKQHPRLKIYVLTRTDAATTGEIQIRDGSTGTVIVAPVVLPANDNSQRLLEGQLDGTFGDIKNVDVEIRRTGGAGTVAARLLLAEGTQSP